MNSRQKLKRLKRDNELMHKIINNHTEMRRLYEDYNAPIKNVVYSTARVERYKCKRYLTSDTLYDNGKIEIYKNVLAKEIFEQIKKDIEFTIDADEYFPTIEANIFVGKM